MGPCQPTKNDTTFELFTLFTYNFRFYLLITIPSQTFVLAHFLLLAKVATVLDIVRNSSRG